MMREVVSEKIAQRLGRYRCERVLFTNKDANGDLEKGEDVLKNSIKNAKSTLLVARLLSRICMTGS